MGGLADVGHLFQRVELAQAVVPQRFVAGAGQQPGVLFGDVADVPDPVVGEAHARAVSAACTPPQP